MISRKSKRLEPAPHLCWAHHSSLVLGVNPIMMITWSAKTRQMAGESSSAWRKDGRSHDVRRACKHAGNCYTGFQIVLILDFRIADVNQHCLAEFKKHWQCLERQNHQLWQCRRWEWPLNKCVFDNLVSKLLLHWFMLCWQLQQLEKTIPGTPEGEEPVHLRKTQVLANPRGMAFASGAVPIVAAKYPKPEEEQKQVQ